MARTKCFPTIDAYCRLIALLVKHSGDNTNSITKINLLNRVSIFPNIILIKNQLILGLLLFCIIRGVLTLQYFFIISLTFI